MNALALDKKEKKAIKNLAQKPFNKLTAKQKKELFKLGSKDFTIRFGGIIKKLANE